MHALYPHHSVKLKVLFVYGRDFIRDMNILFEPIPESLQLVAGAIFLFVVLAAAALSLIRRELRLPRSGYSSSLIECIVPFIGGGSLRMHHKLEKWFFIILMFGAFFIVGVFAGCLLDAVIRIQFQKIETLKQLAETNSPIFIRHTLDVDGTCEILSMKMDKYVICEPDIGESLLKRYAAKLSFVYVVEANIVEIVTKQFRSTDRDFDELKESLGNDLSIWKLNMPC